jgi:hypothetical protein
MTKRCQNVADSCWREFSEGTYHVRLGDRVFCSESCAKAWIDQKKVFGSLSNTAKDENQLRQYRG